MDLRKLKKLIELVEESGIAELEVTEGEEKVKIVKGGARARRRSCFLRPPFQWARLPVQAAIPAALARGGTRARRRKDPRSPKAIS